MKKRNISFEGVHDETGYLFSFAKCLSAAVKNSPYSELADDIIVTSGFGFRMWVDKTLCPSATSIWHFYQQKEWVENGGLTCAYVERLWGQDDLEETRRQEALEIIRKSIDSGIAVVSWDISGAEWGLITGYDEEAGTLSTLKINGQEDTIDNTKLGNLEIPILSVLAITGKVDRIPEQLFQDTLRLAVNHLEGKEPGENASGMAAYDQLLEILTGSYNQDMSWNLEYYLGTYAALKWYVAAYFGKQGQEELADLYERIWHYWSDAFYIKKDEGKETKEAIQAIIEKLKRARDTEQEALNRMKELL